VSVWASVSVYLGGGGLLLEDNCKFVAAEESQIEMEGHVSQEVSQVRNVTHMSQLKLINMVTYTHWCRLGGMSGAILGNFMFSRTVYLDFRRTKPSQYTGGLVW